MDPNILNSIVSMHPLLFITLLVWSLAWKGLALWRAAKRDEPYWFGIILIVNTLGILEIIYIFLVARKEKLEVSS